MGQVMPKVFRSMLEMDGKPMVGASKKMLGIVLNSDKPDVDCSTTGEVLTGGLSVAPSIAQLPTHRIPLRLKDFFKDASGKDKYFCWSMGAGDFIDGQMTSDLVLHVDRPGKHGLLEPIRPMLVELLQQAIAETRELWIVDEPTGVT